jgi:hypothetical protein
MFGLQFASKVNDDAVRLKTHLNLMAARYLHAPIKDVAAMVHRDYGGTLRAAQDTGGDITLEFSHPDLPDFKFWIEGQQHPKLTAQGRRGYQGFILTISGEGRHWVVHTAGDDASSDARKLASVLQRKFDVHTSKR